MSKNKTTSMKSNKVNYLLILISFLFALFATELLLRNYYDKYSNKYWLERYNVFQEGKVFQNFDNFFKYFPNKSILLETYYYIEENFIKEYSYTIKTNNFGLVQENNIQKKKPSILFLGDSITEGQGAFSWIDKFNGSFKNLQIINGGILGTGPEQFELMENHISKNFDVKCSINWYENQVIDKFWNLGFKTFGYTAKGGNMAIPEAMADNLAQEVQFNKKVVAMTTTQTNGEIYCEDGSVYRAEHIISSLPFSVLKNVTITPSIEGSQAEAITTLRSQKLNLLHLVPTTPFWEQDGLSPNMFTDGKAGMVVAERKGSSPKEVTSLTAWLRGSLADELDSMNEGDAIRTVIDAIETLRPTAKNQLEPVAYHSWFQNPYSEGDWAFWGPGQISKFGSNVSAQHGQIHFCGEHTAVSNRGMEGAMESGERVALEIMGLV